MTMLSLDSVRFDSSELRLEGDAEGRRLWFTKEDDPVELHYFDKAPDLLASLSDEVALLHAYRQVGVGAGFGVVEVTVVELDECPCLRSILKSPLNPDTGWGRIYIGSLTIPRRDLSFVLKIQCPERDMTGIREAVISDRLMGSEKLRLKENHGTTHSADDLIEVRGADAIEGWVVDPDDPAPPHLARNVSEDPEYDDLFPDHPLSRVRARLSGFERSLSIAPAVKAVPAFDPASAHKPWWRVW